MRRAEAVAALALAVLLVVAGVAWLFGPLGLVGAGCVLFVTTLVMKVEG